MDRKNNPPIASKPAGFQAVPYRLAGWLLALIAPCDTGDAGSARPLCADLDVMARQVALVPPPRMHLTRYHGVFAPHSKLRAAVTPAGRGKGTKRQAVDGADKPATPRHVAMSRAKRRAAHDGQNPRFLQLNTTSFSACQSSQRKRRKPSSRRPYFRYASNSCST